jgi:hypothetical protein
MIDGYISAAMDLPWPYTIAMLLVVVLGALWIGWQS